MSSIDDRLSTAFNFDGFEPGAFAGRTGTVSAGRVRGIQKLVQESPIPSRIQAWKNEDRKSPAGRRSLIPDAEVAALTVLLIAVSEEWAPQIKTMTDLVNWHMRPKSRAALGLTAKRPVEKKRAGWRGRREWKQWYDLFFRATHSLLDLIDYEPLPHREMLLKVERDALIAKIDPKRRAVCQKRLELLTNDIISLTTKLAEPLMEHWKGNLTIDATVFAVTGKAGEKKSGIWAGNHNVAWYRRDAKNRYTEEKKELVKLVWGLEAHLLAAATNNDPKKPDDFPFLIMSAAFAKPSMDPSGCAMITFEQLALRWGDRIAYGYVTADLGYFPAAKPEKLKGPMWQYKLRAHHDYRKDQLGTRGQMGGAPVSEGCPLCPGAPQDVKDAGIQLRLNAPKGREARQEHATRWIKIAERREIYKLKPHGKMRSDGSQRMSCPASGPNATVKCPLKPESFANPSAKMTILEQDLPAYPDQICTQGTITVEHETALKYRQDELWMSESWQRRYASARNTIEGINGRIKDQGKESLGSPGRRLIKGIAAQSLLATAIIFAFNLRRIDEFVVREISAKKPGRPRKRDRFLDRRDLIDSSGVENEPVIQDEIWFDG